MKNLSVRTQLVMSFLTLSTLLAAVAITGILNMRSLNDEVSFLVNDRIEKLIALDKWNVAVLNTARHMRSALIVDSKEDLASELEGLRESQKLSAASLAKLQREIKAPKGVQLLHAVHDIHEKLVKPNDEFLKAAADGDLIKAKSIMLERARPLQMQYVKNLEKLTEFEVQLAQETAGKATSDFSIGLRVIGALGIFAFALSLGLAFVITRNILGQLGGEPANAASIAKEISAGHLHVEVNKAEGDETSLLASLATMRDQLRQAIGAIKQSSDQVQGAAAELGESSTQMAASVAYQSESTSAMAAAVEEMTVSINHIAENANDALAMSKISGEASAEGGQIIKNAVVEMAEIARIVSGASETIRQLDKQSKEISGVTSLITEVADRTNLLALNAAIEAARAGEEGRGFSVVADEVRKLAERTRDLTAQIGQTVGQVQDGTKGAVEHMQRVVTRVESGLSLANQAGERIESIQSGAQQVIAAISEISASLKEQSAASQDVAKNVEKVSQMTEENSSAADQSKRSATSLSEMAERLQSVGAAFQL